MFKGTMTKWPGSDMKLYLPGYYEGYINYNKFVDFAYSKSNR